MPNGYSIPSHAAVDDVPEAIRIVNCRRCDSMAALTGHGSAYLAYTCAFCGRVFTIEKKAGVFPANPGTGGHGS